MSRLQSERPAEQRDACARAVVDRGLGPAEVVRLAAAGELEPGLGAFTVPPATVSSWASRLRKRRTGTVATANAATPAAERIATMQARLLNAVEHELAAVERAQRKRGAQPVDGERLRQLARALREAAAIAPAPRASGAATGESARPTVPGQREPTTGEHAGSRTRGGLAGGILRDLAGGTAAEPAPSPRSSPSPTHAREGEHQTGHENTTTGQRSTTTTDTADDVSAPDPVREAGEKVAAALAGMAGVDAAAGSGAGSSSEP